MLNELVEADKLLARIALSGDAVLCMADARRLLSTAYMQAKTAGIDQTDTKPHCEEKEEVLDR
jgi:hypothetical protein